MKTLSLFVTVLAVLVLWLNQGESKALNEWNDNYPRDFFDPYDQQESQKQKKHGHRKKDRYDDDVIQKGPFYRPSYNEVPAYQPERKPGKSQDRENEIGVGYDWDNTVAQQEADWDRKIKEKWELPRVGKDWDEDWESEEKEEGSASFGFDSDDSDDEDEVRFEEAQIESDQRRKERLEYELEDIEYSRERLMKRLNRVSNRLTDERMIFNRQFQKRFY